ncbi:asparagine synthase-related protein [Halomonas cupida]|uniref:asparagine synthase-related protein n=1 Tax=Halomonas cupida TaxID=44933 RepID=UPI003A93EE49
MIESASLNNTPLYIRGFVASSSTVAYVPDTFNRVVDGEIKLYIEDSTNFVSCHNHGVEVFVMGVVIDAECPDSSPHEIANDLAKRLGDTRSAFFEGLYSVGGRYAILAKDDKGYFVVGDAGGVRSIFYTLPEDGFLICSHAALLARQISAPVNPIADYIQELGTKPARARNWPGRQSRYQSVYQLTANTSLNLSDNTVERFFPFEELPQRTPRQAASIVKKYLVNSASALVKHYGDGDSKPLISLLTSGIDSRLVLSALRNQTERLSALSYRVKKVHQPDNEVSKQLAEEAGIDWHFFKVDETGLDGVAKWAMENSSPVYLGSQSVVHECAKRFSSYKFGLRGNLGEVSRGVYIPRRAFMDNPPKFMARVWFRGSERHKEVIDAFTDYADAIEIHKAKWPLRILYYLEHRHGTWHAATANVMDAAFDTFNIMNCRAIIEAMCGVSEEDQANHMVHKEIVSMLWPELLEYPINPGKEK